MIEIFAQATNLTSLPFFRQKWLIDLIYLISVILFILGLKRLGTPRTARQGNFLSMLGMLIAIIVTLLNHNIVSFQLIAIALAAGAVVGIFMAKKVAMTAMPDMVAIFNGFGGIASSLVAVAEFLPKQESQTANNDILFYVTLLLSVLIGTVTFSGSLIAFLKLSETIPGKAIMVTFSKFLNVILSMGIIMASVLLYNDINQMHFFIAIIGASFILGITLVMPIGGADMPVVVSLLNSYSGIAVAMTGFVLKNNSLIVVGSLVGASGIILTNIMCKAMNRSLLNVLFGGFGATSLVAEAGGGAQGNAKSSSAEDAAIIIDIAESVIIVPGYGMAVSQAQHVVKKLSDVIEARGTKVSFAIHPVAGRMPGHMNVLLAESGVEYDKLYAMDQINDRFAQTDVVIVIGANDVVNPAAKSNPSSPIYGMPVLDVGNAKSVMVLKRSLNLGFANIENELFFKDNTMMIFGDAKKTVENFLTALDELG